jgi:hypothetical protein
MRESKPEKGQILVRDELGNPKKDKRLLTESWNVTISSG